MKIVAFEAEKEMLQDANLNESMGICGYAVTIDADIYVKDRQTMVIGETELTFVHTPGHTKAVSYTHLLKDCQEHRYDAAERRLNKLRTHFFQNTKQYFEQLQNRFHCEEQETFIWEPHKGRKKYCDLVAIDLVCRINEGRYPIGVKLPSKAVLANR